MAEGLRHEVDTADVDIRDLVVDTLIELILAVRVRWVDEQARDVDAGVVDEDVELAELRLGLLDHRADTVGLRHIRHDVEHVAAALAALKFRLFGVHIADDDIRAVVEERLDHRLADARSTARNHSPVLPSRFPLYCFTSLSNNRLF